MTTFLRSRKALVSAALFFAGILSVVLAHALSSSWQAQYDSLMTSQVADLQQLTDRYQAELAVALPLAPPGAEPWLQPCQPPLVPFDPEGFPPEFIDGLIGEGLDGYEDITVYPVTVLEVPATRELLFVNSQGKELASVPAPAGYDPYWYVRERFAYLLESQEPEDRQLLAELCQTYDPARLWLCCKLILPRDLKPYLILKAKAEASEPGGIVLMTTMWDGTNLQFSDHRYNTNEWMEMDIAFPSNTLTSIDVFVSTNLVEGYWWVHTNLTVPDALTTNLTWTDEQMSNNLNRFYHLGDAVLDTDADGLKDSHEIVMYGSNVATNDSDGDVLTDYSEVMTYDTDPNNSDTNKPIAVLSFPSNGYTKVWLP